MLDYHVGDTVIHANYGLGEIVDMDQKVIHERQMLCYVVKIRNLTIWVQADETGKSGLRPPTPSKDFEKLFTILRGQGEPLPNDRFDRKTVLTERMKDGKLTSICSVIRDLACFKREKKFNDNDKAIMERAQNLLLAEWMYARAISLAQATEELQKLLGTI